jgi:hypothetical protein
MRRTLRGFERARLLYCPEMVVGKGRFWLGAFVAGLGLGAPAQAGAEVTIGSNLGPTTTVTRCNTGTPCTFVGDDVFGAVAPDGLRSPIDGVVVRWRVRSGSAGNPVALRVLRPATDPQWTGAGTSTVRPTVVGTSPFFPTGLPIAKGDAIGIDDSSGTGAEFVSNLVNGTGLRWTPRLADLDTRGPTEAAGAPLVQAQVEPDTDDDGFGDETQDDCPGSPGPRNGCETTPPETTITKAPKSKIKTRKRKKRVRFEFVSSEPGSDFRCVVDDEPPVACDSPFKERFRRGKHRFEVQAIDQADNADPTPAFSKFKLKRKKRRR